MNYTSPYDILQLSPQLVPDRQALLNAKKALLARLELSGKTELNHNGSKYTRDGIEKLFDEFLSEEHWNFHQIMEKDEFLKKFLQTGEWTETYYSASIHEFSNPSFIAFIEKWYASSYEKFVLNAFYNNNILLLKEFLAQSHPLSLEMGNGTQYNVYLSLQKIVFEIHNLAEDKVAMKAKGLNNLREYFGHRRIESLNALPEFYDDIRNEYALVLCELFIVLNNDYRKPDICKALIRNAMQLRVAGYARSEVQRLNKFLKEEDKPGVGRYIWILVVVVIAIIRSVNSSCSDKKTFEPGTYEYKVNAHQLADGEALAEDLVLQEKIVAPDFSPNKDFMYVHNFYSQQYGFVDSTKSYHPIENNLIKYFEQIIPECRDFPVEGKYYFVIKNTTNSDYILFLSSEEGKVFIKRIMPDKEDTCYMNEISARVYILGGGVINQDVVSDVEGTEALRLPFIDCTDIGSSYTFWEGFVSFRHGTAYVPIRPGETNFKYTIVLFRKDGAAVTVENRVGFRPDVKALLESARKNKK